MGKKNVKKGRVPCFAERLRKTRYEAQFSSPAKLAKALGLADQSVQTWEHERGEPCLADLVRLCNGLDVSADYLLGLTDEPRPRAPQAAPAIVGNSIVGSNSISATSGGDCHSCDAVVSTLREAINALAEQLRRNK